MCKIDKTQKENKQNDLTKQKETLEDVLQNAAEKSRYEEDFSRQRYEDCITFISEITQKLNGESACVKPDEKEDVTFDEANNVIRNAKKYCHLMNDNAVNQSSYINHLNDEIIRLKNELDRII